MNKHILTFCLTLLLCFIVLIEQPAVSADFQKGAIAFQRGDYTTALRELKPLAKQGHAEAQGALGMMYDNGFGVPKDEKIALKYFKKAAKQGEFNSQFALGLFYEKRKVRPDYKLALKWYRLSAKQGHSGAQWLIGGMYHEGKGVRKDHFEAIKWYRSGAENGSPDAQHALSMMYYVGEAVQRNLVYSYMWADVALSQGHKLSRAVRMFNEEEMTPAEISKAQDLARQCVKKKYKGC